MCIEVDLSKPLPKVVWIGTTLEEGFWQSIVFEGRLDYCTNCSIHGHSLTNCRRELSGTMQARKIEEAKEVRLYCFRCRMNNHSNSTYKWLHPEIQKPKIKLHCSWCNKENHSLETCWSKPKNTDDWVEVTGGAKTSATGSGQDGEKNVELGNNFLPLVNLTHTDEEVANGDERKEDQLPGDVRNATEEAIHGTPYEGKHGGDEKRTTYKQILMEEDVALNITMTEGPECIVEHHLKTYYSDCEEAQRFHHIPYD